MEKSLTSFDDDDDDVVEEDDDKDDDDNDDDDGYTKFYDIKWSILSSGTLDLKIYICKDTKLTNLLEHI